MAIFDANSTKNGADWKPLRRGLAWGWLCVAAAGSTSAQAPMPSAPMVSGSPVIPPAFNGLQPHQSGLSTDLMTRLGATTTPLTIPLTVQFGQHSGVSFLYNLAAAAPQNGKPAPLASRAATYGFSNALSFGHDSLHLNGLMYFANGSGATGQNKQSQLISQALAFENKGWKLDAHYQSVGKDFGAGDTLKGAATKLGLASDVTAQTAGRLEGLRGQNDLGFALAHTDAHGSFGVGFKENDNAASHVKTSEQTLSLGHTFGHGMQFDASRNTVSAKPMQGEANKALTTTTNHLKLGLAPGKGLSFSAEANLIGDNKGRAEQHLAYRFGNQGKDTQFGASFQTNSTRVGSDKKSDSDQTLGFDFSRQAKGLGLKASFQQFTASGQDGQGLSKTTEHLELALKDTQIQANLQSSSTNKKAGGPAISDKTLNLNLVRQTKVLSLKASLVQFTSTAKNGQNKTGENLELNWQARKELSLSAHWSQASTQPAQAEAKAGGNNLEEKRDLTATLTTLRLHGLRNSQAVVSLAQAVSQGKMQSDTRALRFETDMPDTHVHLEYNGSALGWDNNRNSQVSRAVRIASIAPGDWMHYSAYYKQRSQTRGGRLPDIRDYQVGMQIKHVNLAYHYMNQHEETNGSVTDIVQSHYEMDGPLTKKLAWNVQYDQKNSRAGTSGLENWLVGVKGTITPQETLEMMLGRPELRVDGTTVPGQTFKLTFTCKMDDDDSVAFNGEITNWSRKTRETPSTITGNFRLDLAKGF